MLLKAQSFYIKYLDPLYEVGQFNTLDSKVTHKTMIDAVNDLHGRLVMGFYNPEVIGSFKAALENSNDIIKKEVSKAVQTHFDKNNVNLQVSI